MFRKRMRAVYGVLARRHAGKHRNQSAMRYLDKMDKLTPLRPFERAFKATLLLIDSEYDTAEKMLKNTVSETERSITADDRYTNLYCRAILSGIDGNKKKKRKSIKEALSLPARPIVKDWLPLH